MQLIQNYTVVLFLYCYYYLLFEANFPVGCFNLQSLLTLTVRKKPFHFFGKEKNAIAHSRPPISPQNYSVRTIDRRWINNPVSSQSSLCWNERELAHSCKHIRNPKPHPPPTIRTPRQYRTARVLSTLAWQWTAAAPVDGFGNDDVITPQSL